MRLQQVNKKKKNLRLQIGVRASMGWVRKGDRKRENGPSEDEVMEKKQKKETNRHTRSLAERRNRYGCSCTSRHRYRCSVARYVSSIRRRDYNFVLINAKCRSQVRANDRDRAAIDVKERWKTRDYRRCLLYPPVCLRKCENWRATPTVNSLLRKH